MSLRYLLRRLMFLLGVVFFVTIVTFLLLRITPGDPVDRMLRGEGEEITQEDFDRMRQHLGLDQPFHTQLYLFASNAVKGDLGYSFYIGRPVTRLIRERLPGTLELTFAALFVSILIGVPIGIIAAVRQNSLLDRLIMAGNFFGLAMPNFWFAIIMILFFSVQLGILPAMGRSTYGLVPAHITGLYLVDSILTLDGEAFWSTVRHLILPSLTLGTHYSAAIGRVLRSSMLEELGQDYVNVARSKGLRERAVVYKHALRNALIPVITVITGELGSLLTGSLIIENVFGWPGLGSLITGAIFARDYPVVQSGVIFFAFVYVLVNIFMDLVYTVVDPRIRW